MTDYRSYAEPDDGTDWEVDARLAPYLVLEESERWKRIGALARAIEDEERREIEQLCEEIRRIFNRPQTDVDNQVQVVQRNVQSQEHVDDYPRLHGVDRNSQLRKQHQARLRKIRVQRRPEPQTQYRVWHTRQRRHERSQSDTVFEKEVQRERKEGWLMERPDNEIELYQNLDRQKEPERPVDVLWNGDRYKNEGLCDVFQNSVPQTHHGPPSIGPQVVLDGAVVGRHTGMRSETVVPGFELEANIGHLPKGKPLMFAGEIIYSSASMHDEERPLDKRAIAFESNGTMFFAPTTPNTAFPTHPIWQEMPTETPVASTRLDNQQEGLIHHQHHHQTIPMDPPITPDRRQRRGRQESQGTDRRFQGPMTEQPRGMPPGYQAYLYGLSQYHPQQDTFRFLGLQPSPNFVSHAESRNALYQGQGSHAMGRGVQSQFVGTANQNHNVAPNTSPLAPSFYGNHQQQADLYDSRPFPDYNFAQRYLPHQQDWRSPKVDAVRQTQSPSPFGPISRPATANLPSTPLSQMGLMAAFAPTEEDGRFWASSRPSVRNTPLARQSPLSPRSMSIWNDGPSMSPRPASRQFSNNSSGSPFVHFPPSASNHGNQMCRLVVNSPVASPEFAPSALVSLEEACNGGINCDNNEEDEALLNPFIDEADRFDFAAYLYKGKTEKEATSANVEDDNTTLPESKVITPQVPNYKDTSVQTVDSSDAEPVQKETAEEEVTILAPTKGVSSVITTPAHSKTGVPSSPATKSSAPTTPKPSFSWSAVAQKGLVSASAPVAPISQDEVKKVEDLRAEDKSSDGGKWNVVTTKKKEPVKKLTKKEQKQAKRDAARAQALKEEPVPVVIQSAGLVAEAPKAVATPKKLVPALRPQTSAVSVASSPKSELVAAPKVEDKVKDVAVSKIENDPVPKKEAPAVKAPVWSSVVASSAKSATPTTPPKADVKVTAPKGPPKLVLSITSPPRRPLASSIGKPVSTSKDTDKIKTIVAKSAVSPVVAPKTATAASSSSVANVSKTEAKSELPVSEPASSSKDVAPVADAVETVSSDVKPVSTKVEDKKKPTPVAVRGKKKKGKAKVVEPKAKTVDEPQGPSEAAKLNEIEVKPEEDKKAKVEDDDDKDDFEGVIVEINDDGSVTIVQSSISDTQDKGKAVYDAAASEEKATDATETKTAKKKKPKKKPAPKTKAELNKLKAEGKWDNSDLHIDDECQTLAERKVKALASKQGTFDATKHDMLVGMAARSFAIEKANCKGNKSEWEAAKRKLVRNFHLPGAAGAPPGFERLLIRLEQYLGYGQWNHVVAKVDPLRMKDIPEDKKIFIWEVSYATTLDPVIRPRSIFTNQKDAENEALMLRPYANKMYKREAKKWRKKKVKADKRGEPIGTMEEVCGKREDAITAQRTEIMPRENIQIPDKHLWRLFIGSFREPTDADPEQDPLFDGEKGGPVKPESVKYFKTHAHAMVYIYKELAVAPSKSLGKMSVRLATDEETNSVMKAEADEKTDKPDLEIEVEIDDEAEIQACKAIVDDPPRIYFRAEDESTWQAHPSEILKNFDFLGRFANEFPTADGLGTGIDFWRRTTDADMLNINIQLFSLRLIDTRDPRQCFNASPDKGLWHTSPRPEPTSPPLTITTSEINRVFRALQTAPESLDPEYTFLWNVMMIEPGVLESVRTEREREVEIEREGGKGVKIWDLRGVGTQRVEEMLDEALVRARGAKGGDGVDGVE